MTLLVYNSTVLVGPDDVTYMRGGSIRNRFPFKGNSFSAKIQTTTYNSLTTITVEMNSIRIDGKVFNRSDIDYIKATAPAYAKAENLPLRKILIASRFGNSEYWFGGDNIRSKKCVVYEEYPALYREIAKFLLRDGRLIVHDL